MNERGTYDESDVHALGAVLPSDRLQARERRARRSQRAAAGSCAVVRLESGRKRTWLSARSPCLPAANAPNALLPLQADVAPVMMSEPPFSSSLPAAVKAFTAACEKAVAATMLVVTERLMSCSVMSMKGMLDLQGGEKSQFSSSSELDCVSSAASSLRAPPCSRPGRRKSATHHWAVFQTAHLSLPSGQVC